MATPKEHIDAIRRNKYSIGAEEQNPLIQELHQTVKMLSAELYAKDVHFLMELIQNAEDNEYPEGMDPSLEFIITSRDITRTGAPATLLMFNNEKGFSPKNIDSVCSAGKSTKKGNRKCGYIGEKGIGFKSVFLITGQPYIFSNGYQIRFNEEPCTHCGLGYIVPEWVEENPSLSDIKEIYGSGSTLPSTTIVLPLKPDKVESVKQQLSSVHPEVLLFLSKIKRFSVREDNEDPRSNTLNAIAINCETNFVQRKNIDAESYSLHLSADGDINEKECSYYMWKQKFPVKNENKVERRKEVDEWVITLAFPIGERLKRGTTSPGIYAFLPTEMVTNFPFIIQADFILASSRETVLLDDKWNQGILDCVPSAFVSALTALVKTTDAPVSNLPRMFSFLPVDRSSYKELNKVRDSIKVQLSQEDIIPSESYTEQKFFHKPSEVGRLMPSFWNILEKSKDEGVSLKNLSSHGIHVLNSSFDKYEYSQVLDFLGVGLVNNEWYAKFIQSSNMVLGVSENVYFELLLFIATNWSTIFSFTNIVNIPLIKYVDLYGKVALCSTKRSLQMVVRLSCQASWLIDWNREFRFSFKDNHVFMPQNTYDIIQRQSHYNMDVVLGWLKKHVNAVTYTVYDYASGRIKRCNNDRKRAVAFSHFLYQSFSMNYLSVQQTDYLCGIMPLVDEWGYVNTKRKNVLVPAKGSKWAKLMNSNPWRDEGYIELGEDYLLPGNFVGKSTSGEQIIEFVKSRVGASDIPHISPPNVAIPALSSSLTKQNAFLLLDWIKHLKCRGTAIPQNFLKCIKEGSWLKTTMNGASSFRPPSQSIFLTSSLEKLLQSGSVLVDVPLVDQSFYGESICQYKEELKTVGVMFEYGDACDFIGKHLMLEATSIYITKDNAISILNFIKFLRENFLSPVSFIQGIKQLRWLKTSNGYRCPVGSVLYDPEWKIASQISNIAFIDQDYYGEEIISFKQELQMLGVYVGLDSNYQLVVDRLKSPLNLSSFTSEAVVFVLSCLRHSKSSDILVRELKSTNFLKTNAGYKSPGECFMFDPEWGCLLQVFNGFPVIDENFYGSTLLSWKTELKQLGVIVNFDGAIKAFTGHFKQQASLLAISKDVVFLFLSCCRQLKEKSLMYPPDFEKCIHEEKWLRTSLGDYRSPKECILFGPNWESISRITLLPFIDDSDSHYGKVIQEYENELKSLGVVVDFDDGVKFVANSLCFPQDHSSIRPENVLSLLKCIRIMQEKSYSFPESFMKNVSQKWLKTHAGAGYRSPDQCLLFDSSWESFLKRTDGPFLDEEFYGSEIIKSFRKELNAIGVNVDVKKGCMLLASHLELHSNFDTIVRIYNCLGELNWEPDSEASRRIWIPDGSENGHWVDPQECVLHDKDGLFSSQLNVLDKHYDMKLLGFFSSAFSVKFNPSIDDHYKLWKVWESSRCRISNVECCAFWSCVIEQWGSVTEKLLADSLVKLPVALGSYGIWLVDKHDVFVADDLQLKDLFDQSSPNSLFVWYPQPSLPGLPRTKLLEIYRKIGVRTISESVQKEELSLKDGVDLIHVNQREGLIGKVLVKLILGYLADLKLEAEKRHEAVKCLLNLTILETAEPLNVRYSLSLSSGEIVDVRASQMIRWDRASSKLFTQKMDRSGGHKNFIDYATYFSDVISKGVLWGGEDQTDALSELIKLAFLLEFDEDAIESLMKSKNLQIFMEDEEFLSAAFPSEIKTSAKKRSASQFTASPNEKRIKPSPNKKFFKGNPTPSQSPKSVLAAYQKKKRKIMF